MRAGSAAHRTVETEQQRAYYLVLMAEAYGAAGRTVDGLHALDEAADAVTRSDEHFCEAELYRIKASYWRTTTPRRLPRIVFGERFKSPGRSTRRDWS